MDSSEKRIYKICIVGDGGIGKTTLLHRYVDGIFISNTIATIGTNFFIKQFYLSEFHVNITLQIWDLAGQTHFSAVRPYFYNGAKGIIYTFDLTRRSSFDNLLDWKKEIERVIGVKPSILVGNKLDLLNDENKSVNIEEIESMKQKLGTNDYFKTSAKENIGLDEMFLKLMLIVYNSLKD